MAENAGGAALESSSPSLESVIGDMFGDYSTSAEPEPEAGTPPADASETPSSEGEGSPSETPDGSAAPDATATASPDTQAQPTTDTDPLEGSSPLAYTVNGEAKSFDGITVLKDGAGIIEPDAMEKVQRVFTERDHLYAQSQQRYQESQALDKRLAWTPPGATQPVSGVQAVEALHLSRAELLATVKAYEILLSDPENIRSIVAANETTNALEWNRLGVDNFLLKLANTKNEVRGTVTEHFAKLGQAPAVTPATFDAKAFAPKAVEVTGSKLSPEDKQWAENLAPRFIRLASAEDQQANPALVVGQPMVEQAFLDLVKERAELRANTSKTVSSATSVAAANLAKQRAAAAGTKTPVTPINRTPVKQPERSRDDDFDDAFTRQEKAAAGALRVHAAGGR